MKTVTFSIIVWALFYKMGCSQLEKRPSRLQWPIGKGRLTQNYKGRHHTGIDIAGKIGTPIFSAAQGTVIYAGQAFRGYGKSILIEHSNGVATFYAHLNSYNVKAGQKVTEQTVIGTLGNTGRSSGPHLHFEVRKKRVPVDPLQYLY